MSAAEPVWFLNDPMTGGFWDRLGMAGDLPAHLPMSVDAQGRGPANRDETHHYECWCSDVNCPLTLALAESFKCGLDSK